MGGSALSGWIDFFIHSSRQFIFDASGYENKGISAVLAPSPGSARIFPLLKMDRTSNPNPDKEKKMTSARQIEANRDNSTRSTGPVTEAGKKASALNSYKHGLTAQTLMLQPHELEAQNMTEDYRPKTEAERQLVVKIVDCHIRLNRISAIDNNILNLSMLENTRTENDQSSEFEAVIAQSKAWMERSSELDKLSRYEGRITRQLMQYTKELSRIQKERRVEAVRHAQSFETKAARKDLASFVRAGETVPQAPSMSTKSDRQTKSAPIENTKMAA
jgi:hypothetical protein